MGQNGINLAVTGLCFVPDHILLLETAAASLPNPCFGCSFQRGSLLGILAQRAFVVHLSLDLLWASRATQWHPRDPRQSGQTTKATKRARGIRQQPKRWPRWTTCSDACCSRKATALATDTRGTAMRSKTKHRRRSVYFCSSASRLGKTCACGGGGQHQTGSTLPRSSRACRLRPYSHWLSLSDHWQNQRQSRVI